MPKTRKSVFCPVFGQPEKLKDNMLPTYSDIIKYYLLVRSELVCINSGKDASVKDICEIISKDIENIWHKASLPIISHQQILSRLVQYYNKYKGIKKIRKKTTQSEFYKEACKTLFDISICKCANINVCKCKIKIPVKEREFLEDQREERKMYIGSIDLCTTKLNIRRELRQEKYNKFADQNEASKVELTSFQVSNEKSPLSDSESSSSDQEQDCQGPSSRPTSKTTNQMRYKLTNFASACDRTGVSDRSASILANAVLQDLGVIKCTDSSKVIDRSKLRRERQKNRKYLQVKDLFQNDNAVSALYFDGRKDKTLVRHKEGSKYYRKTIVEEHISLISEPGSTYMGHLTPSSGKSVSIQKCITEFLQKYYNNYRSTIMAIGCDGTAVNTGNKNGVISLMEKHMNRPLQWCVCLLHANELPLRHLFAFLDGTTSGPNSFCGNIGKMLEKCLERHVVCFEKIENILPDVDVKILSTDQKYLYEMCAAISQGTVTSALANRDPGKLAHSRWLTCANRILRLYIGTENPAENLKQLAVFIVKVYAPTWFDIKTKSSCKYGPIHILNMIKRASYLQNELKTIVLKTISRNAYFTHPENILFAMLQDEKRFIRELALRRIIKAREQTKGKNVREFQIPKLNYNAVEYYDLIDWSKEKISEPPITANYSDVEIKNMILSEDAILPFEKFPCHTQAVERCVKLVTEASGSVFGVEARDGYIRTKIKARQDLPSFETKNQYFEHSKN